MGLMDRLYRVGSKPYIVDYFGAVSFLGKLVVPIQIGDIIGSVINANKTTPTIYKFPVRITKPLNSQFTNVNIKIVTFSPTSFSGRNRVTDVTLKKDIEGATVTGTKTTTLWQDTGFNLPYGSYHGNFYVEGVNLQIAKTELSNYNNNYLLTVTVDNGISGVYSQSKIFLEYDNYPTFLNTMENRRFNENQLDDFMFSNILANDMYQVGYKNSIYASWVEKKKAYEVGAFGQTINTVHKYKAMSGMFNSTDELVWIMPYQSSGYNWRMYVEGVEIGRSSVGGSFIKTTTNWWDGDTALVTSPISCFAMQDDPYYVPVDTGFDLLVASVMNYPNYEFKIYLGDTLIDTWEGDPIYPFYFNVLNKKARVLQAGDYADNLVLNRAVETKLNFENNFINEIDRTTEFNGEMLNFPMVKPPILFHPTYNQWQSILNLDLSMACLTEKLIGCPIRSLVDESCNVINPVFANGTTTSSPFYSGNTNLWQIPMGLTQPHYSVAGGELGVLE